MLDLSSTIIPYQIAAFPLPALRPTFILRDSRKFNDVRRCITISVRCIKKGPQFNVIEDLVLCPSAECDSASNASHPSNANVHSRACLKNFSPTLLEKEAQALEGSGSFSKLERREAADCLLDLLEKNGVPLGYAFEFVRHASYLLDGLIIDAKSDMVNNEIDTETRHIVKREDNSARNLSVGAKVCICAERRGILKLVSYFHQLQLKAIDVAKIMPFANAGVESIVHKINFFKSVGVKQESILSVIVSLPSLLNHDNSYQALIIEHLKCLGLTEKEIGKVVAKSPQILIQDIEELRTKTELLKSMGISTLDVRKLVARYPVLLTADYGKELRHVVEYLEEVGVERMHIGKILIRRPILLTSKVEELRPIGDLLRRIHASTADIDKILTSFPGLFSYDPEQDINPVIKQLETLGVKMHLMGKLFRRHPQLLKSRLNIDQKKHFLLRLGIEENDLGRVLFNAPQLLGLSIEDKLTPTLEFLASIGIEGPWLIKLLKLKPMVLAHNVETKLRPNFQFLQSMGIDSDEIGKLVTRHPQLLTLSVEKNLMPTIQYLAQLGYTRDEITLMVRRLPSLLGLSTLTSLEPKHSYLVLVMKRSPKELVGFPQYFSYSLEKRIRPRFELLGGKCQGLSLNSMFTCNDSVFQKRLKKWICMCNG